MSAARSQSSSESVTNIAVLRDACVSFESAILEKLYDCVMRCESLSSSPHGEIVQAAVDITGHLTNALAKLGEAEQTETALQELVATLQKQLISLSTAKIVSYNPQAELARLKAAEPVPGSELRAAVLEKFKNVPDPAEEEKQLNELKIEVRRLEEQFKKKSEVQVEHDSMKTANLRRIFEEKHLVNITNPDEEETTDVPIDPDLWQDNPIKKSKKTRILCCFGGKRK